MEKEIILENLDENIVNEATFYNQQIYRHKSLKHFIYMEVPQIIKYLDLLMPAMMEVKE